MGDIPADTFVIQYKGELISRADGIKREEMYEADRAGSFLYFFEHCGKKYW